jgi:hypothetical protein
MRRISDLNEPWVCPPSLRKVFAKRHALQHLRVAKEAARRAQEALRKAQAEVKRP